MSVNLRYISMNMLRRTPPWLVLLFGMILGSTLTCSLTFHMSWCGTLTPVPQGIAAPLHNERKTFSSTQPISQRCLCGEELEALESKRREKGKGVGPRALSDEGEIHASQDPWDPQDEQLKQIPLKGSRGNVTQLLQSSSNVTVPALSERDWGGGMAAREELVVAVTSSEGRPEWVESVYETWGKDTKQMLIFVGNNFNFSRSSARGLPLVRVSSDTSPSPDHFLLSVLEYLSSHSLPSARWFLLVADNSYVRMDKLGQLLSQFDPSREIVYLGRSATGKKGEQKKLGLKPHEHYCLGSSGIVLSSALLSELSQHFGECSEKAAWVPDDVLLGKCISRVFNIQCKQLAEIRNYFFEDYTGESLTTEYIKKRYVFNLLVTYHPVSSLQAMKTLHHHYKLAHFTSLQGDLHSLHEQLTELCGSLGVGSEDCVPSLCHKPQSEGKPNAGVVSSLPPSYSPTSIYDYQPWTYFDGYSFYPDQSTYPSYKLKMKKDARQELKLALATAVQKSSEHHGKQLKLKKLVNGWVRHNPFVGSEYVIDCLLMDGRSKMIQKRVSLVRPLASNFITQKDNSDSTSSINVVVPLTKVNQRFREFMSMYEQLALQPARNLNLILSVYGRKDVEFVSSIVEGYLAKYPSAVITIQEGTGTFSRGKALHNSITRLPPDALIFICDVDMKITGPFFDRCRRNTIQGKRVYYPEFFKLYNMDYIYWNQERPKQISLQRSHGHWAYYSFGMLCIYKSDYTAVGGMDTNIQGWGDEDIQFVSKVIRKRLDVFRAPDRDLSHRWHEKTCPKTLSKKQYKHCLSSQQENLADRKELARYIHEVGVEIKGSMEKVPDLSPNATVADEEYE